MIEILLKFLESHPDEVLAIVQSILDILKKDPALTANVVTFFTPKP